MDDPNESQNIDQSQEELVENKTDNDATASVMDKFWWEPDTSCSTCPITLPTPLPFLVADTPTHDCIAWSKAYGLNEAIIASLSMLAQPVKCTEPRQTTTKQNQPNLRTTWLALLPLPLLLPCYQSVCPFGSLSLSLCHSVSLSFYLLLAYL